jgi:hypothetical protein
MTSSISRAAQEATTLRMDEVVKNGRTHSRFASHRQ